MKKPFLLFILLFHSVVNFAQQQNANWYFGFHAHLRFTGTGAISQPTGERMPVVNSFEDEFVEGCATISDYTTGNLRFYSNGSIIIGANHQPIVNGTGLKGSASSTQNIVFLPKPNDNNTFYAFTIDGFSGLSRGLFYSEINASGTPFVTADRKNIPLKDHSGINIDESYNNPANMPDETSFLNFSEAITTAAHSNGVDYWVVAHVNNFIYTYLVDCTGVHLMPSGSYSLIANNPNMLGVSSGGQIKIAQPQNNEVSVNIAGAIGYDDLQNNGLLTGTFNRSTGAVIFNNLVNNSMGTYSLEFSNDGRVLYYSNFGDIRRYQFSTNQTNALVTGLNFATADPAVGIFGMQMAANGLIYVSIHNNRFLGSITNSNSFTGSTYTNNATANLLPLISNNFTRASVGLPQLVQWHAPLPPIVLVANNDAFSLSNGATATTSATVLQANPTSPDTMNGNPAVLSGTPNLVVTPVGSLSPTPAVGNVILNANGTITVLAGTSPGTYTLQYQLCTAGSCPVCSSTATVTVVITAFNIGTGPDRTIFTTSLQNNDGKIIIGGLFNSYNGVSVKNIARLNADLSLDTTFNVGSGLTDGCLSTVIQTIGGVDYIVAAGGFSSYKGAPLNGPLVRIKPNGDIDNAFVSPIFTNDGYYLPVIESVVIDGNNKIVIAGRFRATQGANVRDRVVRLNQDGSIDPTFNYITSPPISSPDKIRFHCVRIQAGKILVGGFIDPSQADQAKGIIRLNSNGTLDSTFNSNNYLVDKEVYSFEINPITNKIVVVGSFEKFNSQIKNRILQLDSNGNIDPAFISGSGFEGVTNNAETTTVSFLQDGSGFYVGGAYVKYNNQAVNGICRINSDGSLYTGFNTGSGPEEVLGSPVYNKGAIYTSKLQPDGKLIIGGYFKFFNGVARQALTRLVPQIAGGEGKNAIENPIKDEVASILDFKIYPNPTTGTFNIDLGEFNNEQFDVKIYNFLGQQVLSQQLLKNNNIELNIGMFQSGNYFVVLSNEKRVIKKMIIKQ